MPLNKKKVAIKLVGFLPELTEGVPNNRHEATGGAATKDTVTVDSSSGKSLNPAGTDEFKGAIVYFLKTTSTTALRGKWANITSLTNVGNVATFNIDPPVPAQVQAGDTFMVLFPIPATNVSGDPHHEPLPREYDRQSLDQLPIVRGNPMVDHGMDMEIYGLEVPLAPGATPKKDRISYFLELLGTRRAVAGTTTDGVQASTASQLKVGAGTVQAKDGLMMENSKGKMEFAEVIEVDTSTTPNTAYLSPPLSFTPGTGEDVFQTERTTPADIGHKSFTLIYLMDDYLRESFGCLMSISVKAESAKLAVLSATIMGSDFDENKEADVDGPQSAQAPPVFRGRAFFGSDQLYVQSMEYDLGFELTRNSDTDAYFPHINGKKSTMKLTFRQTNTTDPTQKWTKEATRRRLTVQVGNTAKNVVAFSGMASVVDAAAVQEVNGIMFRTLTFQFDDDQTGEPTPHGIFRG